MKRPGGGAAGAAGAAGTSAEATRRAERARTGRRGFFSPVRGCPSAATRRSKGLPSFPDRLTPHITLPSLLPPSSLTPPPPRGSDLEPMAPRGPPQVPPAADPPRRGRRPVHSRFTLTRIPGPGTAASGTALRTFSGLWAVVSSEALRNISELNPAPHRHGGPDARSSHIQLVGTTPS